MAGGNSTRMEYPKPWLSIGKSTFLSEIIQLYKGFGIENIIVVLNEKFTTPKWEKEFLNVKNIATIITNSFPEKGRLYSLQLGLKTIKSDLVFIHNVDNPFVEKEVLKQLIKHTSFKQITIPTFKKNGGHPVIINEIVKEEIISNYQNYETLKEVFSIYTKEYIEVASSSVLKNINTPQEFEDMKYELV